MAVIKGDKVAVHYTGKFEDGNVFDTSVERGVPFKFEVGAGMVIPGFDAAVIGMEVGDKKTVTIDPENGYGPIDERNVLEVPKKDFPEDMKIELGMMIELHSDQGHVVPAAVVEIGDEKVKLNANHPMAGKTLVFELELLEVGVEIEAPKQGGSCCGEDKGDCGDHKKDDCDGSKKGEGHGGCGCC